MDFIVEAENTSDGKRLIRYFYRCPACGTRINDELITVSKSENNELLIRISRWLF
ncbi:hypothetical protein [Sulfolobus acidocaldarius]|uniref:Conserved protein n=4 Tax=Sulfolobus acidocaldarius TaxID=2285 RepID=Q4J8T1_SULAC|nr:hypothetical protein [Sulfolobus acidocaldarius]AAY80799.1 conserved protein [Sulfolobus acidocaldarius DSM 639]AGE71398.1 hypothetical protein SacN8_07170 [Sulfolobus acidocaldarius N8]AGE73669.1 hypothetical protein SacRon12I_07170 [Sulfolobus acidocaldarius Ron12/I]AHC51716.1 hypothetical protein SUSAZ_07020 [Sulfolobus acidocaldarius SUSAZ]